MSVYMRLPIVSVPVDAYVVVLVPALTVIVPPARMPSVDSGVFADRTTVPVPLAGDPEVEEPEEAEPLPELDDDEPVLPDRMLWIAALSCESTRFNAVPLAMLAKPLPKLVSAVLMASMTESVASMESVCDWLWLQ